MDRGKGRPRILCHVALAAEVGLVLHSARGDVVDLRIGLYPIVTLEKQLLNMIGKLV